MRAHGRTRPAAPPTTTSAATTIPLVVSLGFAGVRQLIDDAPPPGAAAEDPLARARDEAALQDALQDALVDALRGLPAQLQLGPEHLLCGISQVAIGADTLFTRACATLGIPQRVFLPQSRDAYLDAEGVSDTPDFDAEERDEATALLARPHVIEERVVSDSSHRETRFVDTNLAILRECDVLVCLVRADAARAPGGTIEVLEKGKRLGYPVLELRIVEADEASPDATPRLHPVRHNWPHEQSTWRPPRLPDELRALSNRVGTAHEAWADLLDTGARRLTQLGEATGRDALKQRTVFRFAAGIIIGAHLLATICAVIGVQPGSAEYATVLLTAELVLLLIGLGTHFGLHHTGAVKHWALARLTAEICASAIATRNLRAGGRHIMEIPLAASLRPLQRGIHLLQLIAGRHASAPWPASRDDYLQNRLDGQIAYYSRELGRARARLRLANGVFVATALLAVVITLGKLLLGAPSSSPPPPQTFPLVVVGAFIVVLPMFSVAAVSLAASFDLDARTHTYADALDDLQRLRTRMLQADGEREFAELASQAEHELMAETANWASRRSYTSVT